MAINEQTIIELEKRLMIEINLLNEKNKELSEKLEVAETRLAEAVGTEKLANDAVTAAKIGNGQVGMNELANNAVTAAKIRDGQVGKNELANNAVTSAKIRNGAVGNDKLSNRALSRISGGPIFRIICQDLAIGGVRSPNTRRALVDHKESLTINWGNDWPKVVVNGLANGSSRRLKADISDLTLSMAEEILQSLRPRSYRILADEQRQRRLGFVAEETPRECATSEQDGIYLDGILSALVAVIRDMKRRLSNCESLHQ